MRIFRNVNCFVILFAIKCSRLRNAFQTTLLNPVSVRPLVYLFLRYFTRNFPSGGTDDDQQMHSFSPCRKSENKIESNKLREKGF